MQVKEVKLPSGVQANIETVKIMSKIAQSRASHKACRQLGIFILNKYGTKSHHHLDEAIAIGTFVRDHVRYMKDPLRSELLQDPVLMIEKIKEGTCRGDCDDMSLLTACLLISIGIQPYLKTVRYNATKGPYNHIYVVCYEGNLGSAKQRIALDCIIKDKPMGFELPHQSADEWPVKFG